MSAERKLERALNQRSKMRPSYARAVLRALWCEEGALRDEDEIAGLATVVLLADLYEVDVAKVARDVARLRAVAEDREDR